jgi:membrane-bound lytic murein transglycosylase B
MMPLPTVLAAVLSLSLAGSAAAADAPPSKDPAMSSHVATGAFDATLAQQPLSPEAAHSGLSRLSLDKRFHGALDATSTGEMLSFGSPASGSAGYVAMERVRGTLDGRAGSFVLQHSATMARGAPTQSVTVVPDSGTDALAGLAGRMVIDIAPDGAHRYRFDYTLP